MAVQQYPAPSAGGATSAGAQTFTSSSTWTAPTGVTAVSYTLVGAGGGGGSSSNSTTNANYNFPAGGGAGGEIATGTLSVTPGTTYTVTVGAGGAGSVSNTTTTSVSVSQAGGYSSIGLSYTLENAATNGAGESLNTSGYLGGIGNYMGAGTFPTWNSGYNGTPSTGNLQTTTTTTTGTITNISVGSTTRYLRNTQSLSPGGTDYKDLLYKVPVIAGTQYIFSAYGSPHSTTQSPYLRLRIIWLSTFGSSSAISTSNGSGNYYNGDTTWNRLSVTDTAPSGATWAVLCAATWDYDAKWTGFQLESGGSVTNYIGPNVAGSYKTIPGVGIVTVTAGAVASGGGGGQSSATGQRLDGIGYGGGAALSNSGNYVVGGNGAGAGTPGKFNVIASTSSIPYIANYYSMSNNGGGFSAGGPGLQLNSTNQGYILQGDGSTAVGGYGAGGMGATSVYVVPGTPGAGVANPAATGNVGGNATSNTGAGGGGAICTNAGQTDAKDGGNGGSGIIKLSW